MTLRYVSLAFFTLLCFLVWTEFCETKWSELYHHYVPTHVAKFQTIEAYRASYERWFIALTVAYNWFGGIWILLDWAFEAYNNHQERHLPSVLDGDERE